MDLLTLLPVALMAAVMAVTVRRMCVDRTRRRRRRQRRCVWCTYDLTGNRSGFCPECGRPCPHRVGAPQTAHAAVTSGDR